MANHRKRRIVAGAMAVALLLGPSTRALAESAADRRLRILEEELQKTQEELQALRRQVDEQKKVTQETQKKADEAAISARTATTESKKTASLGDWVGRTTLFGDVRYRHEGFYH